MAAIITVQMVANEATRNLQVLDLTKQEIAGLSDGTPVAAASAAMPATAREADSLEGKRMFVTGVGRWSFRGQAIAACAVR